MNVTGSACHLRDVSQRLGAHSGAVHNDTHPSVFRTCISVARSRGLLAVTPGGAAGSRQGQVCGRRQAWSSGWLPAAWGSERRVEGLLRLHGGVPRHPTRPSPTLPPERLWPATSCLAPLARLALLIGHLAMQSRTLPECWAPCCPVGKTHSPTSLPGPSSPEHSPPSMPRSPLEPHRVRSPDHCSARPPLSL